MESGTLKIQTPKGEWKTLGTATNFTMGVDFSKGSDVTAVSYGKLLPNGKVSYSWAAKIDAKGALNLKRLVAWHIMKVKRRQRYEKMMAAIRRDRCRNPNKGRKRH